ncbi:LysR family transcriptional regulator [Streptomyces sp. TRM76323]|uniref:LysR family transcriptional regulator n=1 Tax=Streptomyces tamarix TaxID=3078565 RepID=A0ABU3QQH0_9ACTN|nr:LysR family transcriptional regulator [Streptomyces tamarix]MDT9684977.1 LysR family transcriptional regulator [Streptomyces tamarix]
MNIELRHARIVTVIDQVGSISKAASELSIPQSSLTAQLKRIEDAVGGRLFVRSSSGVVPTSLGERLIPMLAELVRRADMVVVEAAAHASKVFRFGNSEWTPPSLHSALQSSLPRTEVQTETLSPTAAVDAVRRGWLSAALVPCATLIEPGDKAELALDTAVIAREPVWLAVPQGHPLSDEPALESRHLASLNWVRYAQDHWFHPIEKLLFARFPHPEPEVLHYADGHHEAMNWVRDANAAALTTPTGATRDVSLVPISGTESTEMVMIWRSGSFGRATLAGLVETVRCYYSGYARTIPRYWAWMKEHPADFPELHRYLRTA